MKPTQDSLYWPLEPLKVVSFWLALDDVNQGFLSFTVADYRPTPVRLQVKTLLQKYTAFIYRIYNKIL